MPNYVTSADMEVWCEKTIEEAPLSSLKTAAEHLLVSNRNAQRALEVERSITAEVRAEAHQLRVNLHLERDRVAALEARLAEVERERDEARDRATVLDFDREHARLRAIALDEICMAIFGPGEHTVDEVRAAVPALLTRARRVEEAARKSYNVLVMTRTVEAATSRAEIGQGYVMCTCRRCVECWLGEALGRRPDPTLSPTPAEGRG